MAQPIVNRSALLRFAGALCATNFKAATTLRGAFVMQVVFMALNNATFFVFWWALMARVPVLRGWRLADIQVLFGIVAVSLIWMHAAIRQAEKRTVPALRRQRYLPELDPVLAPAPPVAVVPQSGAGTIALASTGRQRP